MRTNESENKIILSGSNSWIEIKADCKEEIGPSLSIRSLAYGQLMHSSEILTDAESLKAIGEYLIRQSEELQQRKDNGMMKEYVNKLSYKGD